jgi:prepilin-type N-terminal cleavage/methylation domain-containing protein
MDRKQKPLKSGFTLIELLIVIVMIGIVTSIALPKVNLSRIRSKAAIQALGTTMLALQRDAIARQHNIVVMIDTATSSLRVLYDSTNDLTINNNERQRTIYLGEEVVFGRPSGVTARAFGTSPVNFTTVEISTSLPAIVLYRNGSAQEFGGLYLSTPKAMAGAPGHIGETWALEMIRATGRAEWLRWNGTTWIRGF